MDPITSALPAQQRRGQRAAVIGASMAGLLAARVLSEHYDEVVLLERDELPEQAGPRKGTPHALQPHGLLARGRQVLDQLFPGFTDALLAQGAELADLQSEVALDAAFRRFESSPSGLQGLGASRLAIEAELRRRVRARPGVRLLTGVDVVAPLLAEAGGRVTGVRYLLRDATGSDPQATKGQSLEADLTVDCSGRGSRSPSWLQSWGFPVPAEERVDVGIAYVSAYFRRDGAMARGGAMDKAAIIHSSTPELPLPGALIAQEPGADGVPRWVLGVGGYAGNHPAATLQGMRQRAAEMGVEQMIRLVQEGTPLGEPARYVFPYSLRRRYERLSRFPQGFLVMGDALTSFNPVYGQGMTVAACEALALQQALQQGLQGLAARFFRAAARVVDTPWQLAVGNDLSIPSVPGPRPLPVRVVNAYVARLMRVAVHDTVVARAFLEVLHLLKEPPSLFRPAIVWRVLRPGAAAVPATARATRRMADLPMPPGLPLLGHLHKLKPTEMHLQLEAWAREFGPAYRISMAGRSVLVLADPEVAQAVLRDRPHTIRRASMIRPIFAELGIDGLFATEGEAWLPQRKLIMQSLNAQNLRRFFPALQAITARLHRRWEQAARSGQVLEMTQELMRYTVDVTSTLSFGEDPNTIDDSGDVIQQHLASIFPMIMRRTLMPVPLWRWLRLPADRRLDRDLAAVHAYARERIARARQRLLADPGAAPANALEAMILEADRPDSGFDDKLIVANVLTLLLGGEDTTAHGLAWSLLYLAQQPALQQQLHDEAAAVLGPQAVCPQMDSLRGLDRFEAAVNEAMRLRPVVSFLALETRQPTTLGDVAVAARQRLFLLCRPAQTDALRFAEPERYDPQRWLHDDKHGARHEGGAHDVRAFLQFGAGPRVCPGRHLAGVEMRLVLSMLMRHFSIELACDPAQVREQLHFTLGPSQMPVRLRLRETAAAPAAAAPAASAGRCPMGH